MAVVSPLAAINERLAASGHCLHVEQTGRCLFVHDDVLTGLSFGLPIETPLGRVVTAAIEGANARRRLLLGNGEERKAA